MPRQFALSALMTRCRQRCDQENSDFISDTELKGLISTVYGELWSVLVESGMRYYEQEQEITTIADAYAAGTMVCTTKANLVDGETFTLHDGYGPLVFEFDVGGTGVLVPGNVQVNVSADTTATEVGARAATAINNATHADGTAFRITALNSLGTVALTNDQLGYIGNQKSFESVANTAFTLTDMRNGGGAYALPANYLATVGVDYIVTPSTDERRPLMEYMAQERVFFNAQSGTATGYAVVGHQIFLKPKPVAGQVYKHVFAPQPPDLSSAPSATVIDVVTPDGEEFLVCGVAIKALAKEESDTVPLKDDRNRALERLQTWAALRALNTGRRPVMIDGPMITDPADYWP